MTGISSSAATAAPFSPTTEAEGHGSGGTDDDDENGNNYFPSLLGPFLKGLPAGMLEDPPAGCLQALVSAAAAAATAAAAGLPNCVHTAYQCTRVPILAADNSSLA
jgi:hypothetical protein